jgi:YggT family protein
MTGLFLTIFDLFYWVIVLLLLARTVLSWVNIGGYQIRDTVFRLTEPILAPVRRYMPATSGVDFSPMVVIFGLILLRRLLGSII